MYKGKKITFKRIAGGIKWRIDSIIFKKLFTLWERLGFHITRNHFYEPIPDTRMLKDDLWQKTSELVGIDINEESQINLLSMFSSEFKEEYESFPRNKTSLPYQYYVNNGTIESVDGEILYCMIRHFKPKKIFEIGSGNSTYLSAHAILKNKEEDNDYKCELVAIEPYPNDILKVGFPGLSKLIPKKVQDIPVSEFKKLLENDILFIDSSHVLKIGSDVQYEYLEILPRLNKGVIVHVHDIFLPSEYPKEWALKNYIFWTEQYLLQAFLAFNDSFEVLWAGSYMHLRHPDKLEKVFSSYKRDERWPGSFWIRKIK
jgi:hypothetical protein